jgi:hypothetical protein
MLSTLQSKVLSSCQKQDTPIKPKATFKQPNAKKQWMKQLACSGDASSLFAQLGYILYINSLNVPLV